MTSIRAFHPTHVQTWATGGARDRRGSGAAAAGRRPAAVGLLDVPLLRCGEQCALRFYRSRSRCPSLLSSISPTLDPPLSATLSPTLSLSLTHTHTLSLPPSLPPFLVRSPFRSFSADGEECLFEIPRAAPPQARPPPQPSTSNSTRPGRARSTRPGRACSTRPGRDRSTRSGRARSTRPGRASALPGRTPLPPTPPSPHSRLPEAAGGEGSAGGRICTFEGRDRGR